MNWALDAPSTLLVSSLLSMIIGQVLLLVKHTLSPSLQPSLNWWIVGTVLHPLGVVFLSLDDAVSPWLSVVLANALIILGFTAYTLAMRVFFHAPRRIITLAILAATGIAISAFFGAWQPDLHWRLILLSIVLGLILLLGAKAIYDNHRPRHAITHLSGSLFLIGGVFLFFRAAALLLHPGQLTEFLQLSYLQSMTYILNSLLPLVGTLGLLLLCTDRMHRNIETVARVDFLTGCYNRRAIEELGYRAMAASRRHGTALTAILFDIDHFKLINDAHGHAAGDQALKEVARRIGSQLRAEDLMGRLGGEEFLVLMPNTDRTDALAAAERIHNAVSACVIPVNSGEIPVTVSAGMALLDPSDTQFSSLLQRADRAMYAAKADGRNRIVADATPSLLDSP